MHTEGAHTSGHHIVSLAFNGSWKGCRGNNHMLCWGGWLQRFLVVCRWGWGHWHRHGEIHRLWLIPSHKPRGCRHWVRYWLGRSAVARGDKSPRGGVQGGLRGPEVHSVLSCSHGRLEVRWWVEVLAVGACAGALDEVHADNDRAVTLVKDDVVTWATHGWAGMPYTVYQLSANSAIHQCSHTNIPPSNNMEPKKRDYRTYLQPFDTAQKILTFLVSIHHVRCMFPLTGNTFIVSTTLLQPWKGLLRNHLE